MMNAVMAWVWKLRKFTKENRNPNIRKSVPTDFCCRYDIILTNYMGKERNDYFQLLERPCSMWFCVIKEISKNLWFSPKFSQALLKICESVWEKSYIVWLIALSCVKAYLFWRLITNDPLYMDKSGEGNNLWSGE